MNIVEITDLDVLNCLNDISEEMINHTDYFVPDYKKEEAMRDWNTILSKNFSDYFQWKSREQRHNENIEKDIKDKEEFEKINGMTEEEYTDFTKKFTKILENEEKELRISDKDLLTGVIRNLYDFRDEKTKELDKINKQINEKFAEAVRNFPVGIECYDADGDIFETVGYQIKPEPAVIGLYRGQDKAVSVCILDIHII